jgi:hypothetical protein
MNTSTENNGFYSENNFSKEDGKLKYPVIIVLILGVILAAFFLFLIFFKF